MCTHVQILKPREKKKLVRRLGGCSGKTAEERGGELVVEAVEQFEVCRKQSWPERCAQPPPSPPPPGETVLIFQPDSPRPHHCIYLLMNRGQCGSRGKVWSHIVEPTKWGEGDVRSTVYRVCVYDQDRF